MNKQEHIKALEDEIEDNISVLIDHCMAGHLADSRLVAACLRGTRNKLKQVRKSAAYEITQVSYDPNRKFKGLSKGVDVASSATIALGYGIVIVCFVAIGVWFYSLGVSV